MIVCRNRLPPARSGVHPAGAGERRLAYVAVTRARRHCALVGDSETLAGDAFLGRLVTWLEERGELPVGGERQAARRREGSCGGLGSQTEFVDAE